MQGNESDLANMQKMDGRKEGRDFTFGVSAQSTTLPVNPGSRSFGVVVYVE